MSLRLTRRLVAVLACAGLAACGHARLSDGRWIDSAMAVQLAAAAGPARGVDGVFALNVRAVGADDGRVFLNSQPDYRDPRNLSVVILPSAQPALRERFGPDLGKALKGQPLLVRGSARLTRIDFSSGGQPSGKYYYQTHVRVADAAQLQVR